MKSIKTNYQPRDKYLGSVVFIRPEEISHQVGDNLQVFLFGSEELLMVGKIVVKETYKVDQIPDHWAYLYRDVDSKTLTQMLSLYTERTDFEVLVVSAHSYNSREFFKNQLEADAYFEGKQFDPEIKEPARIIELPLETK